MITPQLLTTSPLFAGLSEDDLTRIALLAEEVTCTAGKTLFKEGEDASHLYILLSGKVNVQVQPIGLTQPLTVVSLNTAGQLVGWSGFMQPGYYTAAALCMEDTRLIAFEGTAFNRLLDDNLALGLVIMRRIAGVISQRVRTLQSIVLKNLYHHDEQ